MKEPRDEDFSSLQVLLRLKRYETPPADSVEDFLLEFHRRQRAELLRRPLWRIALDRLESFFEVPTLATPRLAYAGACAVALSLAATGLLSRGLVGTGSQGPIAVIEQPQVEPPVTPVANRNVLVPREHLELVPSPSVTSRHASLGLASVPSNTADRAMVHFTNTDTDADDSDSRFSAPAGRVLTRSNSATAPRANNLRPRYVLESQPVRYEPRSSTF